jgi:hypothetical protein
MRRALYIAIGLLVPLLSLSVSPAISSQDNKHPKHRKKHASKEIVLSNDDLPKGGHYVMIPPTPTQYADAAAAPAASPTSAAPGTGQSQTYPIPFLKQQQ